MNSDIIQHRLRLFLLVIAGLICLATPIELLAAEHYDEPLQIVPFVLSAVGFLAVAIALLWPRRGTLLALRVVMALVILGSMVGIYEHVIGNLNFEREIQPSAALIETALGTFHGANPLFAPGILALAGILAIAATYAHPALRVQARNS